VANIYHIIFILMYCALQRLQDKQLE